MDRREFTARLALVALAVSGTVSAQPVRKVYRIGILGIGATSLCCLTNSVYLPRSKAREGQRHESRQINHVGLNRP